MAKPIPIEYDAVVQALGGHETHIDLEIPGWLERPELRAARVFTLQPREGAQLPIISIDLAPLPDGTPRRLVYFSRVYGQVKYAVGEEVSDEQTPLFRIYCVGWDAIVGGRKIQSLLWIYPGGSVVASDEPPYINLLIEHHAAARQALAAIEESGS